MRLSMCMCGLFTLWLNNEHLVRFFFSSIFYIFGFALSCRAYHTYIIYIRRRWLCSMFHFVFAFASERTCTKQNALVDIQKKKNTNCVLRNVRI